MPQQNHSETEKEPSVLDYVKSRLKFWAHPTDSLRGSKPTQLQGEVSEMPDGTSGELSVKPKPQLTSLVLLAAAVVLAILAQLLLEPSSIQRNPLPGVVFYVLSALILFIAFFTQIVEPFQHMADKVKGFPLTFRASYLIAGVLLAIFSFFLFHTGQFNFLNVLLWLVSLGLVIAAFWTSKLKLKQRFSWLNKVFTKGHLVLKLDTWHLAVFLVIVLVLIFRLGNLSQVPAEMIGDQAERLLAVNDILSGDNPVFSTHNNGSEVLQYYWTALLLKLGGTKLSFNAMKVASAIVGLLTLAFVYLLGKEVGNRWVGLLAVIFCGIAYWPNVLARSFLGGIFVPLFVAALLYYLVKGLRNSRMEYFIMAGLSLGLGLMAYRVFLVAPFVVMLGVGLYCLHGESRGKRQQALWGLLIIFLIALIVFIPMLRVIISQPRAYFFRIFSRLGEWERPYPGNGWLIFSKNLWQGLTMFFWSNGHQWVESVAGRPALDFLSGALFFLSILLMLGSYLRKRHWLDLFLIMTVFIFLLPSILSIAFPEENPSLSQASGAMVAVFIILARGLYFLQQQFQHGFASKWAKLASIGVLLALVLIAINQNKTIVFEDYAENYRASAMNTSEVAAVLAQYDATLGSYDSAWVMAYPHWVDTNLVAIELGRIGDNFALQPDQVASTLAIMGPKLFLLNKADEAGLFALTDLYPNGVVSEYTSANPDKSFRIFSVIPVIGGDN